jgi:hypothetical protein
VGEVRVLLVRVSVVSRPTKVVVALGRVTTLSAVGSATVKVVSKPSFVVPSKIMSALAPRVTVAVNDGADLRI